MYESKVRRCKAQGAKLHRCSTDSQGTRVRKKLLAKSTWFKKRRKREPKDEDGVQKGRSFRSTTKGSKYNRELEVKTVLFVVQSPRGELARRLRKSMKDMEQTLGFRVK